jgi:hypothetical protein
MCPIIFIPGDDAVPRMSGALAPVLAEIHLGSVGSATYSLGIDEANVKWHGLPVIKLAYPRLNWRT